MNEIETANFRIACIDRAVSLALQLTQMSPAAGLSIDVMRTAKEMWEFVASGEIAKPTATKPTVKAH